MLEDKDYLDIVKDILYSDIFKELKKYKHHGIDRYTHLLLVSYKSYKKAKKKGLDYKACARAALLHDFYLVNNQKVTLKERYRVLKNHNNTAVEDAREYFNLSDKEADIIRTHMYPIFGSKPKSKEAWLVSFSDKLVSLFEGASMVKTQLSVWILFLINFVK